MPDTAVAESKDSMPASFRRPRCRLDCGKDNFAISRKRRLLLVGAVALGASGLARGVVGHVRIGLLRFGDRASGERYLAAFKQGLRDLGYVEGRNLTLDLRFADGKADLLPGLAGELVKLGVDIIVTTDTPTALAAQRATHSIPIVLATAADPVGNGLVASLAHPGGNITGLSNISSDVSSKNVEFLAAVVQPLSVLAILVNPENPSHSSIIKSVQAACAQRAISNVVVEADTPEKIGNAFEAMKKAAAGGVLVAIDPFFSQRISQIVGLALRYRLPSIASNPVYAEDGLLMCYGQDIADNYRRAATYCDKILRGAKPGDLPVEQSTILKFVVNLKTAQTLGLTVPQALLVRADEIIR